MIGFALRVTGRLFGAAFVVFGLYFGAAAVGGLVPGRVADLPPGDEVEIALLFGQIHVDFVLPATPATRAALGFARHGGVRVDDPSVGYFITGWGARDFYTTTPTWADLSARATIRAILGDASVLRVDTVPVGATLANLPRLRLSAAQYATLLEAIAASAAGPEPRGIDVQGQRPTSGFIEAQGRFHLFRTCNTWVGRMLRASGVAAGVWTPTPYAVRLSLWRGGLT